MYLRWRKNLPDWIRVVPMELPGRGSRIDEPFIEDFKELVMQLIGDYGRDIKGCYAFFGHSMGALLAYGIVQKLFARIFQEPPLALFVSASPAPSCYSSSRLPDSYDDDALASDLREKGGTAQGVFSSDELLRITLNTLGADYRMCQSFQYHSMPVLPVPLHILAGRKDSITVNEIDAWHIEAKSSVSIDWFEGGHFFIREYEPLVLEIIKRELARYLKKGASTETWTA